MNEKLQMINLSKICIGSPKKIFRCSLYLAFASLLWIAAQPFLQDEENNITIHISPHEDIIQSEKSFEKNNFSIDSNESEYYTAAVIDFSVSRYLDVPTAVRINMQNFINIIEECGRLMIDIVVFPEGGLYEYTPVGRKYALLASSYVPAADDFIVPCGHNDYNESPLHYLSCAAKRNKIYVAINLIEKFRSSRSSFQDGLLLYNTAVVFDRNGMVIARYRKFNLYTERWFLKVKTTREPEYVSFTTDFGVKFGVIICFDILFNEPALGLLKKHNVTHFIHLSQIMSTLPFLGAASIDFGWSHALDVIVLTSTIPFPQNTFGTNIYFGRRLGTHTYVEKFQQSKIIVAPVPKNRFQKTPQYPDKFGSLPKYTPGKRRQDWYRTELVQDQMTAEPLMVGNRTTATFSYKSATFQCNISATWRYSESFLNYQFVAFSGLNNYSIASINNYVEICGISFCSEDNITSCQQPPIFSDASKLTFLTINISTRSVVRNAAIIPVVADSYLVALDGSKFDFRSDDEDIFKNTSNYVNMKLKTPITNLLAFGVYKLCEKSNPIAFFNQKDFIQNEKIVDFSKN